MIDAKTKTLVLDVIKSVDIKAQDASDNEQKRKWMEFGAYAALAEVADKVNSIPLKVRKTRANTNNNT